MAFIEGKPKPVEPAPSNDQVANRNHSGVDNRSYIPDSVTMQQLSGRVNDKNYY
jgi:hypothetical protein